MALGKATAATPLESVHGSPERGQRDARMSTGTLTHLHLLMDQSALISHTRLWEFFLIHVFIIHSVKVEPALGAGSLFARDTWDRSNLSRMNGARWAPLVREVVEGLR